jgi:hypothetical protein
MPARHYRFTSGAAIAWARTAAVSPFVLAIMPYADAHHIDTHQETAYSSHASATVSHCAISQDKSPLQLPRMTLAVCTDRYLYIYDQSVHVYIILP